MNKKEIVMTNKPKIILKPKTEWDSWREKLVVAAKRTYTPMEGSYHSEELSAPAIRPGADDHMQRPSRRGSTLRYRDGSEAKVTR